MRSDGSGAIYQNSIDGEEATSRARTLCRARRAAPDDNIHGLKLIGPQCPTGAAGRYRTRLGRYKDAIRSRAVTRPRARIFGVCAGGTICLPVSPKALRQPPTDRCRRTRRKDLSVCRHRTDCSSSERARWASAGQQGTGRGPSPDLNESGLPSRRNNNALGTRFDIHWWYPRLNENPRQSRNQDHHVGTRGFGSSPKRSY